MAEPPPPPDEPNGLKLTKSCCAQTRNETTAQIREQMIRQVHALQTAYEETSKSQAEELATSSGHIRDLKKALQLATEELKAERAKSANVACGATVERELRGRILELEMTLREKTEKLETERAESADLCADAEAAIIERDDELDRLRRELEEKNKIIESQTSKLEAAQKQIRESEVGAAKPSEIKPRARRGYALAPLALQQKAIMAMLRACHSAQAFSQEALSSDELFSGLGTFSVEVGALQRCLGDTGKGTCVHLCRAGLAALRDIEAHVRELLEAGAGMRELLEYMKRGAAPWGKFTTKSSSEFVLMQTGLSLVTALKLVGYPMERPLQIINVREFYQFLLCIRKGDMRTPPRDGCIQFALYHIVRPKVPDFPWDFTGDIEQWKMPLHDYLAEFMAEVGS